MKKWIVAILMFSSTTYAQVTDFNINLDTRHDEIKFARPKFFR